MTKDTMIELLKQIEKDIYVNSLESTFKQDAKSCAIHEAIEILQKENCEDAISRKAVLEILDHHTLSKMAEMEINDLPSVNPILKESPESFNKDANDKSIVTDDLISRNAVDKYISELLSGYLYDEEREKLEQFSAWLWDELPSVQPEQKIIRCKNCKHFKGKIVCEWHAGFYPDAEYFCSDAEVKMEEGE